jgi:hypothetical protein
METRKRQTITIKVETTGDVRPVGVVLDALEDAEGVAQVEVRKVGEVVKVEPNRQRLIKLVTWAAGENAKKQLGLPSEWDQGYWVTRDDRVQFAVDGCGTACCLGGKVAIEDGGVPVRDEVGDWATFDDGITTGNVVFPDVDPEEMVSVSEYARDALGLTDGQASQLFAGSNSYEDVLRIVGELLAPEDDNDEDDEEAAEPPATQRRLKPGADSQDCGRESCNWCYEDVPIAAAEAEPVF